MGSKANIAAYAELVKYSDDQPRDDAGRWSASGASSSPQGTGRFAQSDAGSGAKIDEHNRTYWHSSAGGHFAQGYTAFQREQAGKAGPKEQRLSTQFQKDYTRIGGRSGFAGSGHDEYRHNESGKQYLVERMANGKSFWGTDHIVTEVPSTGLSRNP